VGIEKDLVTLHALERRLASNEAMALLEARASGVFAEVGGSS
jgi:hypothetical protein